MDYSKLCNAAQLSEESFLPPMQFSDGNYTFHLQDKSTFLSCLDQNVSQLKTIFYQAHFPIKDVWDQHRNELSSVLILCGEHRILSDWNNQQVVCDIADLLNMVLLSLGEDLSQLFALTDLACSIIDKLKVKLKSSCYMEYPAAVECFHWVTLNNMVPSVEYYAASALPISLNLLNSCYENSYQQKGLDCIHLILSRSSSQSLHHLGWTGVLFDALKKIHHQDNITDTIKLYKSLLICSLTLYPIASNPSYLENKESWTDAALHSLLKLMEMENVEESRCEYLELLMTFLETLQFKAPQFLPTVLPIINHYIDASLMSSNLCHQILKVVEYFMINFWPCVELNLDEFTWILSKLVLAIRNLDYDEVKEVKALKKSCLQQLLLISPGNHHTLSQLTS